MWNPVKQKFKIRSDYLEIENFRRILGRLKFEPLARAQWNNELGEPGLPMSLIIICLGTLVAVGSKDPNNKKAETFEDGVWTDIQDAPVTSYLSDCAVIFYAGNFYYFGGYGNESGILRLNAATWTWSSVGQLNSGRYGHGAILVDNTFMVIGGGGTKPNEACLFNNGQVTCEEKTSSLYNFYQMPLLFLVSDDFELC